MFNKLITESKFQLDHLVGDTHSNWEESRNIMWLNNKIQSEEGIIELLCFELLQR